MAEDNKGFVIKDRRLSTQEESNAETQRQNEQSGKDASYESKSAGKAKPADTSMPLPEINFSMFIFSLNSSALVQLGLLEDPVTGKKNKNLPLAKQTIDIIGMLEEKTKGNLSQDEEGLLKHLLYDLRMLYVKEKG